MAASLVACGGHESAKSGGGSDTNNTVRVASQNQPADAGLILADKFGFFKEENITYVHEAIPSQDIIGQLSAGNIDVGGVSVGAGFINALQNGIGLRIVAAKNTGPGIGAGALVVRKDLVGATLKDTLNNLKGKPVGLTGRSLLPGPMLASLLDKFSLPQDWVSIKELGYPAMTAGLQSGALAAAMLSGSFVTQALASGKAEIATDFEGIIPAGTTFVPLLYSEEFADKRKDVAQRFMIAYLRGIRAYNAAINDGTDKDRVLQALGEAAHLTPDQLSQIKMPVLLNNGAINLDYLSVAQKFFVEWKMIKSPVNIDSAIDDSFAKKASAVLDSKGIK